MSAGRPSLYRPEYAEEAKTLCEQGATWAELADCFNVSIETVKRWAVKHREFCIAVKIGKHLADDKVEASLYHRALGYAHDDVDIRVVNGEIVKTPIRKHYPPDTAAAFIWLKNRRPDKWRQQPADAADEEPFVDPDPDV